MPFSKNSSISFPLKSALETGELPWTGFSRLPFIRVVIKNDSTGVEKEAKINLQNIVRARQLMTQRFTHREYPNGRPRYRFVEDGFSPFTNEQMVQLRTELEAADTEGYSEPMGLRTLHMNDDTMEDVSKNVPKQQVQNWILAQYPYGKAVHDGCISNDSMLDKEGNFQFELFWIALKKFIISDLNAKYKDTIGDPKKEQLYLEKVNCGDQMVTYEYLIQFVASIGLINLITNHNIDVYAEIYEEFSVLASFFTNDEGPDFVQGCVHPSMSNDPEEIYRTNIQNTILDRRRIALDRTEYSRMVSWLFTKCIPRCVLNWRC